MAAQTVSPETFDFLVRRDDLHRCEFRPATPASAVTLGAGQVLLAVDAFAFTANNITYAVFGDAMKYWSFFPAPHGWGRVPVWGFATVARSNHPDVAVGERVYGYLPMSTHFVADAGQVTASGFTDMAAHRQEMDAFSQNPHSRTAADPGYDPVREAEQMLLRPLFFTGFLIDDFLAASGFFGAKRVVVSSASSKTSIALVNQLFQRGQERCEVIGLTSKRSMPFVESLGIHHRVVAYADIETLDASVQRVRRHGRRRRRHHAGSTASCGDASSTAASRRHALGPAGVRHRGARTTPTLSGARPARQAHGRWGRRVSTSARVAHG